MLEIEWSCGCEMRGWLSWESVGLLSEQEVTASNPGPITTQGLSITEKKVLPL